MIICKILGCNRKHQAKGYCKKHYERFKKHGSPFYIAQRYHGKTHTPEYKTWARMKTRCYNKKDIDYFRYGGRGIVVCDRWLHSFLAFYTDMGPKPFSKAQIDRIDNDGNYEPGNCRWATAAQNGRNRSNNKLTTQKVDEIRKKYKLDGITQYELSIQYRVKQAHISRVINNKAWRQK